MKFILNLTLQKAVLVFFIVVLIILFCLTAIL